MQIKKYLPTIGAVIIGLLPLAVFAVNWYTLMEIAMLDAVSGNTIRSGATALILFSAVFTGFRYIYSEKQQKRYARLTALSFLLTILYAGIFGVSIIGVMNWLDLIAPATDTAAFLMLGLTVIFAEITFIDLRFFDTKANTPVPNAMKKALAQTRTPLSLVTLFALVASAGLSFILPETTPVLILFGIVVLWGGMYTTMLYPVLIKTVVSVFPQRI